ncbi:MAG: D-alanyl-D-alanine carboxypeptidase family protein [Verrucomicrobiota bacterium]|nr:D-alanyl-D-alanine carboxypeptidase family protein [Verrucomicrobiota bacterium]
MTHLTNPEHARKNNQPGPFSAITMLPVIFTLCLVTAPGILHAETKRPGHHLVNTANRSSQKPTPYRPKAPPPAVSGKSVIVLDPHNGDILYAKDPDTRRPIASIQKLLTALVVLDRGNLHSKVRVAASDTRVEPTKINIRTNQSYRKSDLLAVLLVRSGNDVAHCLARTHSGSQENFARAMNAKARSLGMKNSHFRNPHGLTRSGQYSTARDAAILAIAAYRHNTIRSMTSIRKLPFRFADGKQTTFTNTNKVLHRYSYCNGLKTGYTRASGKCLASSARKGNREVIVVILGSSSANIWDDSQKLLQWGLGS